MRKMLVSIAAAAIATTAIMASPAAFASTAKPDAVKTVSWNDLDLATHAGQRELDHRITRAASAVCPERVTTGTLISERQRCMTKVRHDAFEQVRLKNDRTGLGG